MKSSWVPLGYLLSYIGYSEHLNSRQEKSVFKYIELNTKYVIMLLTTKKTHLALQQKCLRSICGSCHMLAFYWCLVAHLRPFPDVTEDYSATNTFVLSQDVPLSTNCITSGGTEIPNVSELSITLEAIPQQSVVSKVFTTNPMSLHTTCCCSSRQ